MKLWITYAWKDNYDGDFDYLVQELEKGGITAHFDRVALIPGQRLWQQIGELIMKGEYDGWAYLVTPASLASEPCKEELEYAVTRAISENGKFPVIGLVHGVPFAELPASLKTRLCVNLSDSAWKEQVIAALEIRPPAKKPVAIEEYIITKTANVIRGSVLYEIRPRFGEIHYWCIAIPNNAKLLTFGDGPPNGNETVSAITHNFIEGNNEINGTPCFFKGSGNKLSPGTAAKVEIANGVPDFIAFGEANAPMSIPTEWAIFK